MGITWQYLAGWFDGEGTVHFSKQQRYYLLSFPNTDLKVMQEIQRFFHKEGIETNITSYQPKKGNYKLIYRITIAIQRDVLKILSYFKEYCITKKEDVEKAWIYETEIRGRAIEYQKWTEEDNAVIDKNYHAQPGDVMKCARILNRSFASVENQIERRNLRPEEMKKKNKCK